MLRARVIPCLLWKDGGLYKTRHFTNSQYIGDPINAIRIFNEKQADELILLNIDATVKKQGPDLNLIRDVASECFMPLAYGGGIKKLEHIEQILSLGVEKVILQAAVIQNPELIDLAATRFGSSTIMVAVDYKKNWLGQLQVVYMNAQKTAPYKLFEWLQELERRGAGELMLQSVDRDGEMSGYDIDTIKQAVKAVNIPLVAVGGAGTFEHIIELFAIAKPSGAAAGSMFVYQGKHRAVLINYPTEKINTLKT